MAVKFDYQGLDQPFEADWPVKVQVPQNGGSVEEQVFEARFRLIEGDELETIRNTPNDPDAFINAFFVGFGSSEKQELTPELRTKMLRRPYVRVAILSAYTNFNNGVAVKN